MFKVIVSNYKYLVAIPHVIEDHSELLGSEGDFLEIGAISNHLTGHGAGPSSGQIAASSGNDRVMSAIGNKH